MLKNKDVMHVCYCSLHDCMHGFSIIIAQDFPSHGKFAPEVCKRGTRQIKTLYLNLCDNFKSYIKQCQEQDEKTCFRDLYNLAKNCFLWKDNHPACRDCKPMTLLSYIEMEQSYLNYYFLGEIIRKVGSQENKNFLDRYEKEFKKYTKNRFYKLPPDELCDHCEKENCVVTFVVSTDEHGFILSEMYDFKDRIGELFGISGEYIYLYKIMPGSLVIHLLFPPKVVSDLIFTSLHCDRIIKLKNGESIRSLKFGCHELNLEYWNILEKVEIGEAIVKEEMSLIRKADLNGQRYMALEYSKSPKELGFVKYLTSFFKL